MGETEIETESKLQRARDRDCMEKERKVRREREKVKDTQFETYKKFHKFFVWVFKKLSVKVFDTKKR